MSNESCVWESFNDTIKNTAYMPEVDSIVWEPFFHLLFRTIHCLGPFTYICFTPHKKCEPSHHATSFYSLMGDCLIRESYFDTSLSILINKADLKKKNLTNCYGYLAWDEFERLKRIHKWKVDYEDKVRSQNLYYDTM